MKIENLKNELVYYLEELDDLERSKTTIKNYNTNINYFIKFLINNNVDDLNHANINNILKKYRSYLKNERKNQSSTRVRYLQEIIIFLEKLNFKIDIKLPKNNNKNKKIKYLTKNEFQTVFNLITNIRDKAVFQMLYRSGLRVSELTNLKKQNLDLNSTEKVISVDVINGKGGKDRTVYIDQGTLKLLNKMIYKRQRKGKKDQTDYLFTTLNGKKPLTTRNIQHIIKKYAIKTDEKLKNENIKSNFAEKLTPHTLRHSFTIHLLNEAQKPINEVQKLLGHSNLATTSIYSNVDNKIIKNSYENIDWS